MISNKGKDRSETGNSLKCYRHLRCETYSEFPDRELYRNFLQYPHSSNDMGPMNARESMECTESAEKTFGEPPSLIEKRANPRINATSVVTVTNLSRASQPLNALVLDISKNGMKVDMEQAHSPGDALGIALPGTLILGEVTYSHLVEGTFETGVKVSQSLNLDTLLKCLQPDMWAQYAV